MKGVHPNPSTHSCLLLHILNVILCVNILYLTIYILFFYENSSPTSPAAKPSPSKPIWHRLPNWENRSNLSPHKRSPASSHSPWSAKTSQMGVLYPATPKIYNLPPPNPPNSERTTRSLFLALFTYIYWRPQPLPNHPAL
jgi:hypothetical protein